MDWRRGTIASLALILCKKKKVSVFKENFGEDQNVLPILLYLSMFQTLSIIFHNISTIKLSLALTKHDYILFSLVLLLLVESMLVCFINHNPTRIPPDFFWHYANPFLPAFLSFLSLHSSTFCCHSQYSFNYVSCMGCTNNDSGFTTLYL